MDVLYVIVTDELGHIILQNAAGETVALLDDNVNWSESYRGDVVGEMVRRAFADELIGG